MRDANDLSEQNFACGMQGDANDLSTKTLRVEFKGHGRGELIKQRYKYAHLDGSCLVV